MLTAHLDHDVACVGADMFAIRERCVIALAAVLLLAGCSKEPGKPQPSSQEQPQAAEQKASPAPAPPQPDSPPTRPEQTAAGARKDKEINASTTTTPEPPRSAERPAPSTAPTAGSAGSSPPPSQQAAIKPPAGAPDATHPVPDVVILKGAPMGGVRLAHKLHSEDRHINCGVCHHPSKAEKPQTIPQQACATCHLRSAVPPMKTKLQAAFHNPSASSGLCIDCHKQENAKERAAPLKCLQCHKKENA